MLTIKRLRLVLPPGFAHRPHAVARLVAHELAALPLEGQLALDRLAVPPVTVSRGGTDRDVAGDIARAIHGNLSRREG